MGVKVNELLKDVTTWNKCDFDNATTSRGGRCRRSWPSVQVVEYGGIHIETHLH